ncbi:MAG: glycosyltransferase family 4 protein [Muribaculaceae bacterium]|nr:glycosyltransferase family 4 protein [Muribaculaceae bacterium]
MKIAINCAFFQPKGGGIKEYIHNLVENLDKIDEENEYVIYVLKDYFEYAKNGLNTRFRIKSLPFKGKGLFNTIIRSSFEQFYWSKEEKKEKWDIFHSPFFHGPTLKSAKLILTVHDLRFFRYPETYPFLRYQFLRRAVKKSINKADKIISISQFTKNEIIEAYHIPEDRIRVIHEAINPNHFSKSNLSPYDEMKIKDLKDVPFLLSVGHLEPRKNYERLIDAFGIVKRNLSFNPKLVIIGKKGHDFTNTIHKIQQDKDIIYLNFVSQELLNWLYENTSLFVFPSIYEGFGFPPLEAGMHGSISAVSAVSSMPEVCGDAVLYFDPFKIDSIGDVLIKALSDESIKSSLSGKMKKQLLGFSWKKNAEETLDTYKSIL